MDAKKPLTSPALYDIADARFRLDGGELASQLAEDLLKKIIEQHSAWLEDALKAALAQGIAIGNIQIVERTGELITEVWAAGPAVRQLPTAP